MITSSPTSEETETSSHPDTMDVKSSSTFTTSDTSSVRMDDDGNDSQQNNSDIDIADPAHARTAIYQDDTEWKDNPDLVDELISREMMQLSLESRTHIQDELHGVGCIAPKETPEFLKTSLRRMNEELETVIPLAQKRAYLQAKQLYPESYVHGDDFKLRFLRCDLFDVPRAAVRMVYFMDLLSDIYGPYALQRPIRLGDFSKHELYDFRKGRFQLLADRDRGGAGTGRRILCVFPDVEWEQMPPNTRHKIAIYLSWMVGNDVDTQRKGICFLAWFDRNSQPSLQPKFRTKANQVMSVRLSAIHICTPDSPFYKFRRAMSQMTAGKMRMHTRTHIGESRKRIHFLPEIHRDRLSGCLVYAPLLTEIFFAISVFFCAVLMNGTKGEPMELRYSLRGFGFPSEKIPITDTGVIKTANLKKWMKLRHLEEDALSQRKGEGEGTSKATKERTIYSPYLTDVIFRKGKSMISHPGNISLRQMIKSKIEKGDLERTNKTRKFIKESIDELKLQHVTKTKKGRGTHQQNPPIRLLIWDELNKDAWKEIDDEDLLYNKMRHVVKHFQKVVEQQKTIHSKAEGEKIINQGAVTSIFLSQDGGTSVPPFCISSSSPPAMKKQKMDAVDYTKASGESLECFGRSFVSPPLPGTGELLSSWTNGVKMEGLH